MSITPRAAPWLFLAPALLAGALFYAGPIALSLGLSFTNADMLSPPRFVGLGNYTYLLTRDPQFLRSLGNTFVFAFGAAALGIPAALLVAQAIMLGRHKPFWRSLFWLPMVTNIVAVAYAWDIMLAPAYGVVNRLLATVGIAGPEWLTDPAWAMAAIVLVTAWTSMGHAVLLFSAGLEEIDESLYEAARLDGANTWQLFSRVTVPLLRPTILFVVVTTMIAGFGSFVLILVMTGGGPQQATNVTALYMYQMAFESLRIGRASAVAWVLGSVLLAVSLLALRLMRDDTA
jgi:multiple sugar transport system permease protein